MPWRSAAEPSRVARDRRDSIEPQPDDRDSGHLLLRMVPGALTAVPKVGSSAWPRTASARLHLRLVDTSVGWVAPKESAEAASAAPDDPVLPDGANHVFRACRSEATATSNGLGREPLIQTDKGHRRAGRSQQACPDSWPSRISSTRYSLHHDHPNGRQPQPRLRASSAGRSCSHHR